LEIDLRHITSRQPEQHYKIALFDGLQFLKGRIAFFWKKGKLLNCKFVFNPSHVLAASLPSSRV